MGKWRSKVNVDLSFGKAGFVVFTKWDIVMQRKRIKIIKKNKHKLIKNLNFFG